MTNLKIPINMDLKNNFFDTDYHYDFSYTYSKYFFNSVSSTNFNILDVFLDTFMTMAGIVPHTLPNI